MEVEDGAESVTLTDDELLPGVEGGGGGSCNAGVKRGRRQRSSTAKERISKMPPCAAGKRSSIYRGVTRHRWTGRYEAHLWDKSTWNQTQNKKGKQVYLGAYDEEEAAARAYDLAALKYWGPGTLINFPVTDYTRDIDEMQNLSREIYLASLRRKSTGFARGLPKFCGEIRDHQNMRWDPQFGRFVTSHTPQGSMELNGASCSSTINLSKFLQWLQQPGRQTLIKKDTITDLSSTPIKSGEEAQSSEEQQQVDDKEAEDWPWQFCEPYQLPSLGLPKGRTKVLYPPALSLVLQSSMFQDMLKRVSTQAIITEKETIMPTASNDSIDASAHSPVEPSILPLKPEILISDSDRCDLDKTMYSVQFNWNKY